MNQYEVYEAIYLDCRRQAEEAGQRWLEDEHDTDPTRFDHYVVARVAYKLAIMKLADQWGPYEDYYAKRVALLASPSDFRVWLDRLDDFIESGERVIENVRANREVA